ncbi:MAG: LbtU family siderophore porin [Magnetococcales bacterium]|nr:LbtU family siderophore porin [Magnetococcales bacterium]
MMKKTVVPLLSVAALLGSASAAFSGDLPSREEMWKILQQQQQEINALKQELGSQKREPPPAPTPPTAQGSQAAPAPQAAAANGEQKKELPWSERINLSGVVDVRANTMKNYAKVHSSDVVIDTVKLAADVKVSDLVKGRMVLLHEEPLNTSTTTMPDPAFVDIDEATITLGDTDKHPLYLTAGRKTVPFGRFTTTLISDPLTQQLGETKESVAEVGFKSNGAYGSVYAFNGNANKKGKDTIDQFGADLGYGGKVREVTFDFGASMTNSLEDSEVVTARVAAVPGANITNMQQHVSGAALHASAGFGGVTLLGEFITAMDRFDLTELPWNGRGAKPRSWNLEAAYGFQILGKETTTSIAWQGSDEALALGLPENRFMLGASMGVYEKTTLAFEWMHDKDYGTSDTGTAAGTNRTANTGTAKLAVEF